MQLPHNFDLSMLRQRRKVNGFPKQTDVANFIGRHVNTIQRLEQKGILPTCSASEWVKLQVVYGLTVEQFAEIEQQVKKQETESKERRIHISFSKELAATYDSKEKKEIKNDRSQEH